MTLMLNIGREEINKGIRYSSDECMVALALRKKGFIKIFVGAYSLSADGKIFTMPTELTEKIWDWDRRKPIEPFSVEIKEYEDKTIATRS